MGSSVAPARAQATASRRCSPLVVELTRLSRDKSRPADSGEGRKTLILQAGLALALKPESPSSEMWPPPVPPGTIKQRRWASNQTQPNFSERHKHCVKHSSCRGTPIDK